MLTLTSGRLVCHVIFRFVSQFGFLHFQILPFDPTKKKKKKKVTIQDPADDAAENLAEKTENLTSIVIGQTIMFCWHLCKICMHSEIPFPDTYHYIYFLTLQFLRGLKVLFLV